MQYLKVDVCAVTPFNIPLFRTSLPGDVGDFRKMAENLNIIFLVNHSFLMEHERYTIFDFSLSCTGEGNGNPHLAWRIPGMGEPGGLLSMGSHRIGHD